MVVKSLDLKNFRNYHELHIDFDPFTNIFYGNNAQERRISWNPCILRGRPNPKGQQGSGYDHLHGGGIPYPYAVQKKNLTRRIDMHLKKNKTKGIAVDGIPIKKASELFRS